MRTVPTRPRATTGLVAAAAAAVLVLAGCGGDEDGASPFAPPKGESKAAASLGIPVVATRNTTRTATDDPVVAAAAVARASFPGGSEASRPKAVAIVDRADWRTALAATALVAPPVSAPLLFSDGSDLPDATDEAIDALRPTGVDDGGAQALRVGDVGRPTGVRSDDITGKGPYELARAIDRYTTQARSRTSDRVLVVSADRPEFALPAAAWMAKTGDPVAFVTRTGIPAATARQLASHPKAKLYVLGPSAVVRPAVTKQLRKYGTVKRVGGVDPVANAIGFARYKDGTFGWDAVQPGRNFLVARAGDTLGAITLAPFGTSGLHGPLLLNEEPDALSVPLREYLRDIKPGFDPTVAELDASRVVKSRAWIAGDVAQISAEVQAQIDTLLEVGPVSREPTGGDDGLPREDEGDGQAPTTTGPSTAGAPPARTSTTPTPRP